MKPALFLTITCLITCSGALPAHAQTGLFNRSNVDAVVVAANQYLPAGVALDDEFVYWVSDAGSSIKRVKKAGGVPVTLTTGKTIDQIIVDEQNVFFTVIGEIRRVNKNGGASVTLVKSDLIRYQRFPMVVDKTNLYFYEEVGVPPGTLDKNPLLRKVNKAGGTPVTLSSNTYRPGALATDGMHVYWGDDLNGTLKAVSVNGGRVVTLGGCSYSAEIVVDSSSVYCKRIRGGILRLKKVRVSNGKPLGPSDEQKLLPDDLHLYVLKTFKGIYGIHRITKSERTPQLVVPLDSPIRDFATDYKSIYWTDLHRGTVMRLDK